MYLETILQFAVYIALALASLPSLIFKGLVNVRACVLARARARARVCVCNGEQKSVQFLDVCILMFFFFTVHHSILLFHLPTLMHNSFII